MLLPVDTFLPTVDTLIEVTSLEVFSVFGITILAIFSDGVPSIEMITLRSSSVFAPTLYPCSMDGGGDASLVS